MFDRNPKPRTVRKTRRAHREGSAASAGLSIATVFTALFVIVAFTG